MSFLSSEKLEAIASCSTSISWSHGIGCLQSSTGSRNISFSSNNAIDDARAQPDPSFLSSNPTASRTGRCFIHKAKRNSNMTFSKGKTWNLEDLRLVEVMDVSLPSPSLPSPCSDLPSLGMLSSIRSAFGYNSSLTHLCYLLLQPLHFSLTMSKTYRWETEREREQAVFLEAVVKTYKGWVGKLPRMNGFAVRPEVDSRAGGESRSRRRRVP